MVLPAFFKHFFEQNRPELNAASLFFAYFKRTIFLVIEKSFVTSL
jgi:hypothetical protein